MRVQQQTLGGLAEEKLLVTHSKIKLSHFTTVWKESDSIHTGPWSQGGEADIAPAGWT